VEQQCGDRVGKLIAQLCIRGDTGILELAPTVSECAETMRRRARSAELADLEQMPVGIAKEAADLLATLVRRRQENGAPRQ
jgi:hypothetical protein